MVGKSCYFKVDVALHHCYPSRTTWKAGTSCLPAWLAVYLAYRPRNSSRLSTAATRLHGTRLSLSIPLTSSLTALSSERFGQIPQEEITELPAGLSGFLSSRASL